MAHPTSPSGKMLAGLFLDSGYTTFMSKLAKVRDYNTSKKLIMTAVSYLFFLQNEVAAAAHTIGSPGLKLDHIGIVVSDSQSFQRLITELTALREDNAYQFVSQAGKRAIIRRAEWNLNFEIELLDVGPLITIPDSRHFNPRSLDAVQIDHLGFCPKDGTASSKETFAQLHSSSHDQGKRISDANGYRQIFIETKTDLFVFRRALPGTIDRQLEHLNHLEIAEQPLAA